jgi:hypothetical protein
MLVDKGHAVGEPEEGDRIPRWGLPRQEVYERVGAIRQAAVALGAADLLGEHGANILPLQKVRKAPEGIYRPSVSHSGSTSI